MFEWGLVVREVIAVPRRVCRVCVFVQLDTAPCWYYLILMTVCYLLHYCGYIIVSRLCRRTYEYVGRARRPNFFLNVNNLPHKIVIGNDQILKSWHIIESHSEFCRKYTNNYHLWPLKMCIQQDVGMNCSPLAAADSPVTSLLWLRRRRRASRQLPSWIKQSRQIWIN